MDRDTSRRRRGIRRDRLASVVLGLGKKSIESVAASSPTWETLEVFARQSMQQLRQRMLKEEVDGVLGRARYERRDAVGYFFRPVLSGDTRMGLSPKSFARFGRTSPRPRQGRTRRPRS